MRAYVGGGWVITHLTDRCCELTKESYEYRALTQRDGFVRVRAEPGMDRSQMIEQAIRQAARCDAELATLAASSVLPTGKAWADYRTKLRALRQVTVTDEEPELIGRKSA